MTRPTKADLEAARSRVLRDVIGPGLDVLFCGINPGLHSGATGHHFARPGNRFWPAVFASGFTPRLLTASEDTELPAFGCGVTNLVARTTATADELAPEELTRGRPAALMGPQPEPLAGARVWVLPNPSGLNANYQLPALERAFRDLRTAAGMPLQGDRKRTRQRGR